MKDSTNPIHVKGNSVFLIEKQAKEALKKEETERVRTDRQLQTLGIRNPRVQTNFEFAFKKLIVEKKMLKRLKSEHNKKMRLNGLDPKKRINVSGSQTIKFTS